MGISRENQHFLNQKIIHFNDFLYIILNFFPRIYEKNPSLICNQNIFLFYVIIDFNCSLQIIVFFKKNFLYVEKKIRVSANLQKIFLVNNMLISIDLR